MTQDSNSDGDTTGRIGRLIETVRRTAANRWVQRSLTFAAVAFLLVGGHAVWQGFRGAAWLLAGGVGYALLRAASEGTLRRGLASVGRAAARQHRRMKRPRQNGQQLLAVAVVALVVTAGVLAVPLASLNGSAQSVTALGGSEEWSFATGGRIQSSPTVADDTVYVGSNDNNVYALDTTDGSKQWSFSTGGKVRSSPTVADGTVYVGSYDSNIYALDATDGTQQWSFSTGGKVRSSLTAADGTVYAASNDNKVYALDATDGSKQWSFKTGTGIESSPTIVDGTVYIGGNDNKVYALNATDGSKQWSFATGGPIISSPTVADGTVYVGNTNSNVLALDATDGSKQWSFSTGNDVRSSPTVADGTVYVGSYDSNVYALDATDGSKQWSFKTGDVVWSSPTVAAGTVYVGGGDNSLYALDATDGTQQWSFSTGDDVRSSPTVVDGTVYVGGWDNNVYALGTDHTKSSTGSRVTLETLGMLGSSFYTDTVSGTVTDADGNALNGANVTVEQSGSTVATTTTDSSGAYSVDLSDGDYTITVNDGEYQAVSRTVTVSGSAKTVDYQLPYYTISGTLTDANDNALDGVDVRVTYNGNATEVGTVTTDSSGGYSLGVPNGNDYDVVADPEGYERTSTVASVAGSNTVADLTTGTIGYEQPVSLDDNTGTFAGNDPYLVIYRWTGEGPPRYSPTTSLENYEYVRNAQFNWEKETSVQLRAGDYYTFRLLSDNSEKRDGANTAETVGYKASPQNDRLVWTLGTPDEPGVTVEETADGIQIQYQGEPVETLNYTVEGPDGAAYNESLQFEEPTGYYEGELPGSVTANVTDSENLSDSDTAPRVKYDGTYANGTAFNGSAGIDEAAFAGSFGPVGGGGEGGGPAPSPVIGGAIAIAVVAAGIQWYGPGLGPAARQAGEAASKAVERVRGR